MGAGLSAAEARSALAWWLAGGVDDGIKDEPRNWLSPTPKAKPPPAAEPSPPPNVAPPSHETLAELQSWLSSSMQLPLASPSSRRVMPHGAEDAEVMLLTD